VGTTPTVTAHLPEALTDAQRSALLEFYAGRISAGEFSRRLGLTPDDAVGSEPTDIPAPTLSHPQPRLRRWPRRAVPATHA